jgi:type I restriction enzyme S subunit
MVVTCFSSYYEKFADGKVVCIDDELPYSLPLGWTWCRLNELGIYRKGPFGSCLTKSMFVPKNEHSIKVYEQKNAIQKDYRLGEYYISEDKFAEMQSFVTKPFDIIVSCAGTIGETYLLPEEAPIGIINQALMRVELYNLGIADYWQLFFAYILLIENEMKGAGSAIKNIPPFEYLKAILVPIPPLQEQKRIIEKYNELTKLISQYTQQKEVLDLLNDNLYPSIKKSILQEAIQGKLVPQDPADEPASVLLERIKEEKLRLVTEGKLKKKDVIDSTIFRGDDNKYYEQIGQEIVDVSDEIPFDLPESWQWTRLGRIVRMSIGKTPARGDASYWAKATKPWVSISDMTDYSHIKTTKEKISDAAASTLMGSISPRGSLLMSFKLTVGRTSILDIEAYHNEAIISIYPYVDEEYALRDFLFYSLPILANMGDSKDAIKGKTLNSKSLNNLLIPLPPLKDQERIVRRIVEIFNMIRD